MGDRAETHHGTAQLLYLEIVELVEDRLAIIGTERQQERGSLLVARQHALFAAHLQLLADGGGRCVVGGLRYQGHGGYAALPSQSRTISAACLGFSSTRSPTILRVWSWVSPIDFALATQAGVLSRVVTRAVSSAWTLP